LSLKREREAEKKEVCDPKPADVPENNVVESCKTSDGEKIVKKRGRKPKGGKIILKPELNEPEPMIKSNVILHLKCGLSDISSSVNEDHLNVDPSVYIPDIPGEIKTYNTEKTGLFYRIIIIIIIIIMTKTPIKECAKTNHQMTGLNHYVITMIRLWLTTKR
jgi:hypothetical protein